MMNFCTYAVSNWQLRIANRPDNESEKMTNFLRRERRITDYIDLLFTKDGNNYNISIHTYIIIHYMHTHTIEKNKYIK